jgi:threonine dehydrogenase-like Zn-dependent dehydrogenase
MPMKAATWTGRNSVEIQDAPQPTILNNRDAILKVTSAAICGSDLHLYDGYVPTVMKGDILGHEFMGRIVEKGPGVGNLEVGDRIVVPFPIACGACAACRAQLFALCENTNPNAWMAEKLWGFAGAGIYGYSHLTGGYAGGQAEYVRVPFADVNHLRVPDGLTDEQVLFLGDILPTGFMGAEFCDIKGGETVAVWGAGPVGQFALASARMLGAEQIIAIDRFPYRLRIAAENTGAITINYEEQDVAETLRDLTGGRGPDAVIDAVGMEAHSPGLDYAYDRVKQAVRLETDRPNALREAITNVRNGGIVSVIGAYGGLIDKFPIGAVMNRGLTIKAGQCHVHRYMQPLLDRIQAGDIDPTFIITHRMPLEQAPAGYELFKHKQDECLKVVLAA